MLERRLKKQKQWCQSQKVLEGKLRESENTAKLAQIASTEWESKYQNLLASSENDKKILGELRATLEQTQKKLETSDTDFEHPKKELDLPRDKSEEDWTDFNKYYAWTQTKIDSEYCREGFEQAKHAIIELNLGVELNLDIDSCRLGGIFASRSPYVPFP